MAGKTACVYSMRLLRARHQSVHRRRPMVLLWKLFFHHLLNLGFEIYAFTAPACHPVNNNDCELPVLLQTFWKEVAETIIMP